MRTHLLRAAVWMILACGVLGLRAAAQEADPSTAPRITMAEFKRLRADNRLLVVDVRDAASYRAGHIPGALSIPLDQVVSRVPELKEAGKPIVTYCA